MHLGESILRMKRRECKYPKMHAKSLQSYLTLCNPMDCSLPGSCVHGILEARILEWVTMPPGDLPSPGIEPAYLLSPALAHGFFSSSATWEAPLK